MIRKEAPAGKVTVIFELPATVLAEEVAVVGEFNDWDPTVHRLLRGRDGVWRLSVELERGRRYRFRYLADRRQWINEGSADEYEPTRSGGVNAVLRT